MFDSKPGMTWSVRVLEYKFTADASLREFWHQRRAGMDHDGRVSVSDTTMAGDVVTVRCGTRSAAECLSDMLTGAGLPGDSVFIIQAPSW